MGSLRGLNGAPRRRYSAAILWVSDGEVHGGETWQLQCAYLLEEGNQELHIQQQPWADWPWRLLITFVLATLLRPASGGPCRGAACGRLLPFYLWTPHAIRPTPYAPHPTTYTVRPTAFG
jgi:hypothetical protein